MKLFLIYLTTISLITDSTFAKNFNDSLQTDTSLICDYGLIGKGHKLGENDFNKGVIVSPLQLIQGKVPGFIINSLSKNDPNPIFQVQLRGISTLYLNTEPLYVVDGIYVEDPELIPVKNIQSIEVLKNLSETAIYGIRGCNGVVVIETKKNTSEKINISYETQGYFERYSRATNYMSANEWRRLKSNWENSENNFLVNQTNEMVDYGGDTDWRKEISQNKLSQNHNINLSGKYKKTGYSAFFGFDNHNGIIKESGNRKLQGQLSVSQLALKDKLRLNMSYFWTDQGFSKINDNPFIAVRQLDDVKGNIITYANFYNPTVPKSIADTVEYYWQNPHEILSETSDQRFYNNSFFTIGADYNIINGLNFYGKFSRNRSDSREYYSTYKPSWLQNQNYVFYKKSHFNLVSTQFYNLGLNYNKSRGDHAIDAIFDLSLQTNKTESRSYDSTFISKSEPSYSVYLSNVNYDITDFCVSLNYYYKNKFTLSYRYLREFSKLYSYTGSKENFHGISVGWSLKQESLFKQLDWLSDLDINAGYGNSQRMYKSSDTPSDGILYLADKDFHGEDLREFNFSIASGLFKNRFQVSVNNYWRTTTNGILFISYPLNSNGKIINELEVRNKGWEFQILGKPLTAPITWTFNFGFSINNNSVLSNTINPLYYDVTFKNQSIGNFYGYHFLGYKDSEYAALDFEMMVLDYYGDTVTDVNLYSGTQKILGNGVPKSFINLTNYFNYKKFDLSVSLRGAVGFEIKNMGKIDVNNRNYKKNIESLDKRHFSKLHRGITATDIFIENGNYLKIDNISWGYTKPFENSVLESIRFYATCSNVAIFSKFKDGDPEMAGINGINAGMYYYQYYPITRLYSIGLKVTM